MSKIHVLDQAGAGTFNAVAHFLMPAGSNSVNVTWKTCYLGSFGTKTPTSILPSSGNNNPAPGKIGNTELTQITSGDVIEISFQFPYDATLSLTDQRTLMNVLADRAINDFKADFAERYRFYGDVSGTVV